MKPRNLIILVILGLSLGVAVGWMRANNKAMRLAVGRENRIPSPQLRDRVRELEQELATARTAQSGGTVPQSGMPLTSAPVAGSTSDPSPPSPAALSRLQAFNLLKEQGASIRVSVLGGGKSPTAVLPAAKTFFGLSDEEAAKVETVFANARREVDQIGTEKGIITAATVNSITVIVPATDNAKEIRARTAADLTAAIGPERAQEIMEIGAPELERVIRSFGGQERNITITRVIPPANVPSGFTVGQYRLNERITNGAEGTNFNNPAEKEGFAWLSKFNPELEALVATGR